MTLNELIARASAVYPDGLIAQYWNEDRQRVDEDPNVGDTLALFIARELQDTYDPTATDARQIAGAVTVLLRAQSELQAVIDALGGQDPGASV